MKLLSRELLMQAESIQIPSRKRSRFYERGEKSGVRKGCSLEFSDYREYLQGDDIRSIDWNVYARTERLFLKLFLEEQSKPVYFLVDNSQSMNFGNPTKFDFARAVACLLSFAALKRYDRPHILFLQQNSLRKYTFHSRKEFFPLLEKIEEEGCGSELRLNAALRQIALARYPRGVYFLLSDYYSTEGYDALKILAAAGNELNCLQILSYQELHPDFRGDLKLLDSETADHSEVSISAKTLKRYAQALQKMRLQIQTVARQCGAFYYCISTSTGLSDLVFHDLRSAGILR